MKALIVTANRYPRSGAASNYIQYFAAMLESIGYEVVVSCRRNEEQLKGALSYHNVKVVNTLPKGNKFVSKVLNKLLYNFYLAKKINAYGLGQNDIVVDYSYDQRIYEAVFKERDVRHFQFVCCPTEWFSKEEYEGDFDQYTYLNEQLRTRCDLLFPISEKIDNHYKEKGCKTFKIPIMCDSQEFDYVSKKEGRYKIIVPANGKMKDALDEMLIAVSNILCENSSLFEFHITGVTEKQILDIIGENEFEKISKSLIVHSWMQYTELVELYQSVHYLLLARGDNQMTQSNFPSKIPECMCYGIVPIMSNVGDAPKYYLNNKINSLVFEGCSVDACESVIREAVTIDWDTYKQLSESAHKTAEMQFDYRNWGISVFRAINESRGYTNEN